MRRSGHARWILAAAVAAVPLLLGTAARAQYQVGQDGSALDANTRLGSGGRNGGSLYGYGTNRIETGLNNYGTPNGNTAMGVTGNQIVTGNVTGGKEFRGQVPYADPRDFRGNVAGSGVDRFIAGSSGGYAPYRAGPIVPGQVDPFYGSAKLATPPPPGYVEQGFSGTYTPPIQPTQPRPNDIFQRLSNPIDNPTADLMAPGPVDIMANTQLMTGSMANPALSNDSSLARLRLDPLAVQQMREELVRAAAGLPVQATSPLQNPTPGTTPGGTGPATPTVGPTTPGTGNLARPLAQPFDSPQNTSLTPQPLDASISQGALIDNPISGQSISNRLANVPPGQQSTQYTELERRLNRFYTERLQTDEQRNREFLQQLRAKQAAEKKAGEKTTPENPAQPKPPGDNEPGGPATPRLPGRPPKDQPAGNEPGAGPALNPQQPTLPGPTMPDYARISREMLSAPVAGGPKPPPGVTVQPPATPQPLRIESLAAGVKAEGLAKLLRNAETDMKAGKFVSALDDYRAARQIAPENSMVLLGAGNAELGAGFYKKSEADLRAAMAGDPVLMMAQLDLRTLLGPDRLETLTKDLKQIAAKQANDPGPIFLLAYIAYNSGNERQAGTYLDLAEKRAGNRDAFYRLLRTHWAIPGEGGATPAAPAAMPLSEMLKQFDDGNIKNAIVTETQVTGQLKTPITLPGGAAPVHSFKTDLPAGATSGPLGKWIAEHAKGADIRMETPTTQPAK